MSTAVEEYDLTAADRFQAPLIETTSVSAGFRFAHAAPLLLSLIAHLGLVVGMAFYGVPNPSGGSPTRVLLAAPAIAAVEFEKLPEVKMMTVDANMVATSSAVTAIEHVGDVGESMPSPLAVVAEQGSRRVGNSALDDVMGLFKGDGQAYGDSGEGQGGAEFFGVKAGGNRFVFVVDSSKSMRGKKWTLACRELLASVKRMNPNQAFYVIFFDIDTHPMFSQKRPERELLPVTSGNQRKLLRWLPSIKLGPDTRPHHAMQLALRMKPDAIFLLSDGEFNDGTRSLLLDENFRVNDDGEREAKVPVHTVGFHSLAAEASLKPIALDNGGVYRFVPK